MLNYILLILFLLPVFSFAKSSDEQVKTVEIAKNVEINKYLGKWYAITTLPQFFTTNCVSQTAEYEVISSSKVSVLNVCYKTDGSTTNISGSATVENPPHNSILNVKFNNIFTKIFNSKGGDYIIFKLDPHYRYALVGSRNLKSLWLLSRTKKISDHVYDEYIGHAAYIGFDTTKLADSQF